MRDARCIGPVGGTYEFPSKIPVPAHGSPLNFRRKSCVQRCHMRTF